MPRKAFAAGCSLLLLLAGCAGLSAERRSGPDLLNELFPATGAHGGLSAEADVRIAYGGRGVTLPAAAAFRPPSAFRLDILDPLDRPVAMIFLQEGRIIQYRPAAAVAAAVMLMPGNCAAVDAGAWTGYVVGTGPGVRDRASYRPSWLGLRELLRYREGAPAERIAYGSGGGKVWLRSVEWFCQGDVVMKLVPEERGGNGIDTSWRGTVSFPFAGLSIDLKIGKLMSLPAAGEDFFRPRLPASTRWMEWRLVHEQ